jgi:hypothetical protein
MKHQFLPDEHFWTDQSLLRRLFLLCGPAINSAAFKKMAARCSQAMLAHALDSNAFAMAFDMRFFSKMSKYDMFMVVWCRHGSSISSSNFFASDIKRSILEFHILV